MIIEICQNSFRSFIQAIVTYVCWTGVRRKPVEILFDHKQAWSVFGEKTTTKCAILETGRDKNIPNNHRCLSSLMRQRKPNAYTHHGRTVARLFQLYYSILKTVTIHKYTVATQKHNEMKASSSSTRWISREAKKMTLWEVAALIRAVWSLR